MTTYTRLPSLYTAIQKPFSYKLGFSWGGVWKQVLVVNYHDLSLRTLRVLFLTLSDGCSGPQLACEPSMLTLAVHCLDLCCDCVRDSLPRDTKSQSLNMTSTHLASASCDNRLSFHLVGDSLPVTCYLVTAIFIRWGHQRMWMLRFSAS